MNKKILTFALSALSSLLLLSALISCAEDNSGSPNVTTTKPSGENDITETETQNLYDFPDVDYDGHEFVIMNVEETNWANATIVPEEISGDILNDALYNRNSFVEDKLNIKISNVQLPQGQLKTVAQNLISAGDHVYDVMMQEIHEISGHLLQGYFVNLYDIDELHLEEKWWDQIVIESSEINGKLYFASSDISLFPFEATWVCYFNETLFENYGIEYPYDTVRDGKWTIDKLIECAKAGISLNGEASFAYTPTSNSIYGLATHGQFMHVLLFGANETLIGKDSDSTPYFTGASDRFYSVIQKITEFTGTDGLYISRDNVTFSHAGDSPSNIFKSGQFLFVSETLGHINNLRDFEMEFGVLPAPKYDETQDSYQSMIATWGTLLLTVPVTNTELERTGTILDLLAYQSYVSLMEPYYDTYLTQKGARNVDSSEMLAIIRDTRTLNVGHMYGWTSDLFSALTTKLNKGNPDVASDIASREIKITENITKTLDTLGGW